MRNSFFTDNQLILKGFFAALYIFGSNFCFTQKTDIGQQSYYPNKKGYHKFKISTNLIRPMMEFNGHPSNSGWALSYRFISSSRDVSIEPEYHISNQFSIALPIYFGLTKMNIENYESTLNTSWSFVDSNSMPELRYVQTNYQRRLDLIGQIGLQGKWFPWGHEIKHRTNVYPFISAGLILALYDIYSVDFHKDWDENAMEEAGQHDYYGNEDVPSISVQSHKTGVFRTELLTGIELMFGKNIGLTYSIGYSTKRNYFSDATDRLFASFEDEPSSLVKEIEFPGEDNLSVTDAGFFINRLQLTIAFGSK